MNALTHSTEPPKPPAPQTRAQSDLLAVFLNAVERTPAGNYSISDRRSPLGADRDALQARRGALLDALRPADKAMVAARVGRLFLRFPGSRLEDAEATVAAYATDLSKFPLWAVDRGLMSVIEGRSYGTGTFAPSSVECQRECERALRDVRAELADLTRVLDAEVYHELSATERDKVKAGFDELIADLRLREPFRPIKRAGTQPTMAEAESALERLACDTRPVPALSEEVRKKLAGRAA